MTAIDTKERIFMNGQVYSRPRFGGSVHGPDTRPPFRPDSNPYDVPPAPRGYGQGSVAVPDLRDLLLRPTDTFEIRKPVYRPEDKVENVPLAPETGKRNFLYQYLEQNKEVLGPKTQMFDRYADPDDGTLIAADPSFVIPREVSPAEVREINRRVISDYEKKKEMLRRGFLSPLLRGV